jgi:UDP-N-acetylglucosamine--N-acetylmuramyl-(pentapeptide) pyrophosphoryl-undecaprenol N-acetylglucosamine transferase
MIGRVIVAGGGTGGHLFPGIAVVEELRRRQSTIDVLFVGTGRGLEARVLPARGERLELINIRPLKGRSPVELMHSVSLLPRAFGEAVRIVRKYRPDLVVGLGGYASGPLLTAASVLKVPTALLEQNIHVGMTNRLLAPAVGRAYLTHEETSRHFGAARARVCGNPVRREFVEAARIAAADPEGVEARSRNVLVLGGSQGARSLNRVVPGALAGAGLAGHGVRVVHQTGEAMLEEVRGCYRDAGVEAEVLPFIDDMARAYRVASVVIARAGATTLAELCAVGRPSILIPYPYAADDHQARNALALEKEGAALVVRDEELDADDFGRTVGELLADADRRRCMAEAARRQGRPGAAAAVVDDLYAWLDGPASRIPQPEGAPGAAPGSREQEPAAGTGGGVSGAASRRKPGYRRCRLRVRIIDESVDATG